MAETVTAFDVPDVSRWRAVLSQQGWLYLPLFQQQADGGERAQQLVRSHRPSGLYRDDGRFIGNSGAWCPAFEDKECTKPVLSGRPLLFLSSEGEAFAGGLHFFRSGELVLDERGGRPVSSVPSNSKPAAQPELPIHGFAPR